MREWKEICRKVLVHRRSKRAVCEKYRLGWRKMNTILAYAEPPGYRHIQSRPKRVLVLVSPIIHEIIESYQKAPKNHRHAARRNFELLKAEHDYTGGKNVVWEAVRA